MEDINNLTNEIIIKTINTVGRKKQTIISLPLTVNEEININELLKSLKKHFATGGNLKNNIITLSGDHSINVFSFFKKNFNFKDGKYKFLINGKLFL